MMQAPDVIAGTFSKFAGAVGALWPDRRISSITCDTMPQHTFSPRPCRP